MNDPNVYDPSLIQQLVAMGAIPEQQDLAKQKMAWGREDSQMPMPAGMRVGGTYIASSPLEHLAAALKSGMGYAKQGQATGELRGLIGQQTEGRSNYAQELLRALGQ